MEHVIEFAPEYQQRRLRDFLIETARALSCSNSGCVVIDKALSCGEVDDRFALARTLLGGNGLVNMADTRFGSVAVKTVLQVFSSLPAPLELEQAVAQLHAGKKKLLTKRYGRQVVAALPDMLSPQSKQSHNMSSSHL